MNYKKSISQLFTVFGIVSGLPASIIADFEGLSFASGNFENGSNLSGSSSTTNDPFGPSSGSLVTKNSVFQSGNGSQTANFSNTFNENYDGADGSGNLLFSFWSGWAYSKDTDSVTSGLANEYSAIPGVGAGGSSNYGISFGDTDITFSSAIDFTGLGFQVTNTTYAHNSMRDGDAFAKKFGDDPATIGITETDQPDWFLLTVEGFLSGGSTGTVEFYLADFRFADDADDYIISTWEFVNLTALGTVDELAFDLTSSDVGAFGMNTPDYFAIDNIGAVPEPSAFALLMGVFVSFCLFKRRRG
ncbi:MAG: DUF4465 domain-containing protein [Verrucomicrobiota bacterium]